ncbi:MAG: DNA polymerase III subunit beta [Alphaproteobacteria bacterium]|nr:DNA polymerase III subunit beta [Alphaproteobacteria bacterium]
MDLYIDRDELGRGLARIQGIIERRSTHPLLSHVLLHARDGGLRMTATDTEVAYIGDLSANVSRPGQLTVDAANLFQVVRSLPEATVQLTSTSNKRLEVRSGRSQFKLPGSAAEDFPALPAFDARGTAKMAEGALRRLVEQTAFSVATDDVRYGLNGAHLEEVTAESGEKRLRMVATDGHRLASAEAPFEGSLALSARMLVPRKALAVMRKLLEGDEDQVEIGFGDGAIRLSRPEQTFWFRLLDGEFPDYHAVVPTENKHRAMARRDELGAALKRVGILVQDRARAVRFAFSETELEIEVQNADRGEVREVVAIELEGAAIQVGFNARYLAEVIGVLRGDRVSLELAHPLAPCLVRDSDHDDAFFVIMPMRLD